MFRFVALLGAACLAVATVALVANAQNNASQAPLADGPTDRGLQPVAAAEAVPTFHLRFSLN